MQRAMRSPKRVFLFSIALLTALALGGPSGALAEAGLDISSTVSEPGGALVAQWKGIRRGMRLPKKPFGSLAVVPDVKGKPQAEAERLLKSKGLNPQVGGVVPTTNRTQAGKVASQSPEAGKTVPKGTKVALRVLIYMALPGGGGPPPGYSSTYGGTSSSGVFRPSMVNTPGVIGMPQAEAERLLRGRGLDPRVAMGVPTTDRQQVGKVASQNPKAGTTVPKGTRVVLSVLRYMALPGGGGPPPGWHPPGLGGGGRTSRVNTPGVIGMPQAEAERKLRDAGFGSRVRRLVVTGERSKGGRVKFHQPPPGMPALPGTTVSLDVYKFDPEGPQTVTIIGSPVTTTTIRVPFVVRMTKAEAEKALRDRGFGSRVKGMAATDSNSLDGKVSSQEPGGGRWVDRGTTVSLDIYKAAPRVVGLGWSAAVGRLRSAGYTAHVKKWSPVGQDSSKRGMVTRQYAAQTGPGPPSSGFGPAWLGKMSLPPPNPLVGNVGVDLYKYAIVVPDVIRMKLGDAKKKLKEAGYKVGGSTWVYVKDQSKHCKVQKTYPSAGTSLKKGETVYLEVWTTYQEWAKDPAGHAPAGYLMGTLVRGENPCFF